MLGTSPHVPLVWSWEGAASSTRTIPIHLAYVVLSDDVSIIWGSTMLAPPKAVAVLAPTATAEQLSETLHQYEAQNIAFVVEVPVNRVIDLPWHLLGVGRRSLERAAWAIPEPLLVAADLLRANRAGLRERVVATVRADPPTALEQMTRASRLAYAQLLSIAGNDDVVHFLYRVIDGSDAAGWSTRVAVQLTISKIDIEMPDVASQDDLDRVSSEDPAHVPVALVGLTDCAVSASAQLSGASVSDRYDAFIETICRTRNGDTRAGTANT